MYKNERSQTTETELSARFNPCFNGTMYKNYMFSELPHKLKYCFNPCFNGTMYKNSAELNILHGATSFNPCFNGTMYKNTYIKDSFASVLEVSILVLMELCIKTIHAMISKMKQEVSILVLMDLCIKTYANPDSITVAI